MPRGTVCGCCFCRPTALGPIRLSAFGDVHDCCTRNHQRKRLPDLIAMWKTICM
jgi:hypothetical protein